MAWRERSSSGHRWAYVDSTIAGELPSRLATGGADWPLRTKHEA